MTSIRQAAQNVNVSVSAVYKLVKKFRAYKIKRVHTLQPEYYFKRERVANLMLERTKTDPRYLKRLLFSDDATCHTSGFVNSKNVRLWGIE